MVMVMGPTAGYCGGNLRVTVEAEYAEADSVVVAEDFVSGRGRSVDPDYVSDDEVGEIGAAARDAVGKFLAGRPVGSRPVRVCLVSHHYNVVDSAPFYVGSAAVRAVRAAVAELAKGATGVDFGVGRPGVGRGEVVAVPVHAGR